MKKVTLITHLIYLVLLTTVGTLLAFQLSNPKLVESRIGDDKILFLNILVKDINGVKVNNDTIDFGFSVLLEGKNVSALSFLGAQNSAVANLKNNRFLNFKIQDDQYDIVTNLFDDDPEKLLERHESYKDFDKVYSIKKDGEFLLMK